MVYFIIRDTVEAEIYAALVRGREEKQRRESGEAVEQPPPVTSAANLENIGPNASSGTNDPFVLEERGGAHFNADYNGGGKCCPVCNVVFPTTMLNAEINAHLDICLAG